MATFLRTWSYRFPQLYNSISFLASLSVGGEKRFHFLPLEGLSLPSECKILDLCCGGGQATEYLVQLSPSVTGLDASSVSLKRAVERVPTAQYVESLAEHMPFSQDTFELVHTSVALHEMDSTQLEQILREVYRVLAPGGQFVLLDLHRPTNPLFWPPLALFMLLFETKTAWQLINTDLSQILKSVGFREIQQKLHAGGSLQVIQSRK